MNQSRKNSLGKADLLFQQAFTAHQAGNLSEAEALYRRALRKAPCDVETLYLLGTACSQQGKFEEASTYLEQALKLNPDYPEALNNLGLTLRGMGKAKDALTYYRRALVLRPDFVDAHNNMGQALEYLNELDEAEQHLRRALELNPLMGDAYCNLGKVLKAKDRFEEAVACFLRGIELKPDFSMAYDDLGQIYKVWGRFETALTYFERTIALAPDTYSAHNNLGAVLDELGRHEEALAEYERAAALNPKDSIARWNQAFLFLRQGILERGWKAHEVRFETGQVLRRFPFYPEWDGSSIKDKTILIYSEQGLGDEILFASCFPEMIERAKHCVIECEPRLAPLFSRSFPTATVVGAARSELDWVLGVPDIDVRSAAGSLPRFLRPTMDSFPKKPAYLVADPKRVEFWRSRLALLGSGLKVGICWRSGLTKGERHKFYSELTQWGEVFKTSGVHFINLQYDECTEELDAAREKFGITITSFSDIDLRSEIDESAALIAGMDLVISASTAISEIAGALGVEQFRINSYGKLWDCLGCTDRMPWHPSVRLFNQEVPGDWDTELAEVAQALREMVSGTASSVDYVRLMDNAEVAVNGALSDPATYVLQEQHRWFDPEYDFVLKLIEPDMRIVDLGAGEGAYAIPMARKAAHGKTWAIAHSATEVNLLMKSRTRNRLAEILSVSIADEKFSFDSELNKHGLDEIAFVRIAPDRCKLDLLASGMRFFAVNSPLLMLGLKSGACLEPGMAGWLNARGYGLYRCVPGLGLLAPFSGANELDAFSVYLFACKPDRAEWLERRGVLIRQPHTLTNYPGIDRTFWQGYLGALPYAAERLHEWITSDNKPKDWEVYWMALNLFAMAKMDNRQAAERFACLQAAESVMTTLVAEQSTLARLLSLCRIWIELGKREAAVHLLNQICDLLNASMARGLEEPCLALSEEFAQENPGARVADWIVAMVLERRESLRAFSTFFTGQEALPVLDEVKALGFGGEGVERRIALIRNRFADV